MKLISKIKNVISKFFKKENLSFLEVGDIIWAKRYKTEEEMLKIPEDHREGPYVIVYTTKKNVYALPCTSNKNRKLWQQLYTELDKYDYDLDKNTFVRSDVLEPLETHQYISKISSLYDEDLNLIFERLVIAQNNHYLKKDYNIDFDVPLTKGSIVSISDRLHYIYDVDETYYHLVNIKRSKKSDDSINIHGITYKLDYNSISKIKICNKHILKLLNFAGKTQIKAIDFRFKTFLKNKELENTIRRGSIVSKDDDIYFIFGEYKYNWQVIKLTKTPTINSSKTNLCNTKYYTEYKEILIPNSNLVLLSQTSEEEIERMRHLRKTNKPKMINQSPEEHELSPLDKMIQDALGLK